MSSSYAPCAACKYLRRKCPQECVFAPYFPPDNPQKFINVHKVFGASNVGKILNELSPNQRNDAVNSLAYEAECRIKDPIYGCVGFVSILQHHLRQVQQEIDRAKRELSTYIGPAAMQPMLNNPAAILQQQQQQNLDPGANYHNPHQTAPFQGQVLIQEQPQQLAAMAREQEMLRAYAQQQQQQQEQLYLQQMQQQELYSQQQQRMQQELYVQQQQQQQQDDLMRFNDAVDPDAAGTGGAGFVQIPAAMGSFENQAYQYQVLQQEQQQQHGHPHHHQQQLQIDHEFLLQQQQQQHLQLIPQHLGSHSQQQQGERDGSDDEHSFSPL